MDQIDIYVLDDDADMLSLLDDVVTLSGYTASCFQSAADYFAAVKQASANSLMILDLNMPGMDGVEVMRNLARQPEAPALLLLSGNDVGVLHSAEKLGRAYKLNIVASLMKPVSLKDLQQALQQYVAAITSGKYSFQPHAANAIDADELLQAIEGDELRLKFQPKFNIASGRIVGCEALVRWQHPQKGLLLPNEFIELAASQGWMGKLTSKVVELAVKQALNWQQQGISLAISVNISADNITSLSLPEQINDLCAQQRLNPSLLTLEITENALMGELVTSLDILTRLRIKGIALSIDDFGTGYSSLSLLHRIPFNELKIDRSFVIAMLKDSEARAIVKTCIILGHELNMTVVAEGVESAEHLALLREFGCDVAQGYYLSRPVFAEELSEKLANEWK